MRNGAHPRPIAALKRPSLRAVFCFCAKWKHRRPRSGGRSGEASLASRTLRRCLPCVERSLDAAGKRACAPGTKEK